MVFVSKSYLRAASTNSQKKSSEKDSREFVFVGGSIKCYALIVNNGVKLVNALEERKERSSSDGETIEINCPRQWHPHKTITFKIAAPRIAKRQTQKVQEIVE